MWMPEWLYERLPLLYVVAGGACLWFLGTTFEAAISALPLLTAALLTYGRRRSARTATLLRAQRYMPKR